MAEKTIEDFIAKDNKDIPFEERAKKFENALAPISKEYGVGMGAVLQGNESSIIATPVLKDLWTSSKE